MRLIRLVAVGVVILIMILIATVFLSNSLRREPEYAIALQQAVTTTSQVVGLIITTFAVLMLLTRTANSDALHVALAVLGGILIFDRHWAVLVVFLGLAVLLWVNNRFIRPTVPPT
jgi:hypothetical protein